MITTFLLPTLMRPGRGSSLFSDSQVVLYGMLPPYGSNYALFMIAPSIATWLCCVRVSTRFPLNSQMDTVSLLPSVPLPPATFFLCRSIEHRVSLSMRLVKKRFPSFRLTSHEMCAWTNTKTFSLENERTT